MRPVFQVLCAGEETRQSHVPATRRSRKFRTSFNSATNCQCLIVPLPYSLQKKYLCTVAQCEKRFIIEQHLKRHIETVHGFVERQNVKCDHPDCEKVYASRDSMKKHFKQVHLMPKTYDCPQCDEKFSKKKPLRLHLYTHTGEYPQKCEHCSAGFLNLKELRAHHAAKHTDGKYCPDCSLYFANWSVLVAHRKAKHPATHDCPECGKHYYSRSKLKIHIVSHQKPDEWLLCSQETCKFRAKNRTTLIAHIRRNHGDKNFKCDQCEKRFARLSFLLKHQKAMHGADKKPAATTRKPRKDRGIARTTTETSLLLAGLTADPSSCAMELMSTTDTESEAMTVKEGYAF